MTRLAAQRLHAQRLLGEPLDSAVDVVRWFGAVQSQDYGGAKWALGQRTQGTTDSQLNQLFDQGAILRTHVLRPTWHFVAPEDIRWLLQLTGPRVRLRLKGRHRQLEIDSQVIAGATMAFSIALADGHHLTRPELGDVLRAAGISTEAPRLAHLIMIAELDGLIASGPRRGREFTYALLEERAPVASKLDRDEALVELTCRYFRSHGPAQIQDFVWWSGLTVVDARIGLTAAGSALQRHVVEGKEYWSDANAPPPPRTGTTAHLLPNFDEYTVAYRDRSAVATDGAIDRSLFSLGSILSNVLVIDGQVRGWWQRTMTRGDLRVEIRLQGQIGYAERIAVEDAARRLSAFLGKTAQVAWS